MGVLIASISCTLVILAFCQILVEMILPEGSTKKYVMFLVGLVGVAVIVSTFAVSGAEIKKQIFTGTGQLKQIAEQNSSQESTGTGKSPYQQYIEKMIDAYR